MGEPWELCGMNQGQGYWGNGQQARLGKHTLSFIVPNEKQT